MSVIVSRVVSRSRLQRPESRGKSKSSGWISWGKNLLRSENSSQVKYTRIIKTARRVEAASVSFFDQTGGMKEQFELLVSTSRPLHQRNSQFSASVQNS
ncbi:hypothetical protein EUGRSUZ_B03599 [Eucalyptus grandis]|uniref:Uncharacterized protein n=5 Tax=Eucalyptus grandis TaxID=71139 RepID=A0ACC3LX54_EUCGR|nr:hypothetical protein EUGRSUZ_B03599 [Eucalyptus grandis]KAK3443475.1 hypothetical protein EUGRSUZ_B03599 [Eucalyptus grandis]